MGRCLEGMSLSNFNTVELSAGVEIDFWYDGDVVISSNIDGVVSLERDEAIAAAKAILKHFGET